ncbi:MAG: hypothetical protein J6P28_06430 [Treponema sp.]|nr:hypothetical protein [Treponema sp.]
MKKKIFLTIILDTIFVIVFNLLFFLNGAYNIWKAIWICYAFLHFSYLMVLLTPIIEVSGKTSKLTSYSISLSYFLIELIFTMSVYFKKFNKPILSASAQIIITAIYLVVLISNIFVNDSIATKQTEHDIQNNFIKSISIKTKLIESITVDTALKNKVNNLHYLIHSSPIKTCAEVAVYESKLQEQIEDLESLVTKDKDTASKKILEITETLNKRNNLLKIKN